jgi:pyruvate dehydrogenase E1 component beta subunit
VPDGEYLIPLGKGECKRAGSHVTLIAWNKRIHDALAIAEHFATEGIEVEVLDMLTLQPLDEELIFASVRKTHRLVIYDESFGFASVAAQIATRVMQECFDDLDAPVEIVSSAFVPIPYAEHLEHEVLPTVEKGIKAINKVLYR